MNKNKNLILLLIQVTEDLQDYKIIQQKSFLQNEIVIFSHLILMVNYKIAFIFNISSGFLFQWLKHA